MEQDIRWKQRFQNFSKTLTLLKTALQIENPDIIQKAGAIQFFEMSFELSWKLVKDYLEEQGFNDVKSPRSALKKGFEIGIITDGHGWMELLTDRNQTSHLYDEAIATAIQNLLKLKYYPLLEQLYLTFKNKSDEQQIGVEGD